MEKEELLLRLYCGRKIKWDTFNTFFGMNGSDKSWYIYYVEKDDIPQFELHAHIDGDYVNHVETFKADVYGGHGRPTIIEKGLTSAEKKYAFEVFDQCFEDQAESEIDSVIDAAIASHVQYDGYQILKRLSDSLQYSTPDGKKAKLAYKRILQALDYSHLDIAILRDTDVTDDFMSTFGKAPFEPLFAVLSCAKPELYLNYEQLNNEYRFSEFETYIHQGAFDKCTAYTDLFDFFPSRIPRICNIAISESNPVMLQWILERTEKNDFSMMSNLNRAMEVDNEELFNSILHTKKYDVDSQEAYAWNSPLYTAICRGDKQKYLKPLLLAGFTLSPRLGYKYSDFLKNISLDEIKELLSFNVIIDTTTIHRIIESDRQDILEIIMAFPEKVEDTTFLLIGFAKAGNEQLYYEGLDKGFNCLSKDLFLACFANGSEWVDALIERGYDVNENDGWLLHHACEKSDVNLATYLLDNGANPELKGKYSGSIFEVAAGFHGYDTSDQEKLCRLLLDRGLNPIEQCSHSPSSICYMMGYSKEFKLYLVDWLHSNGYLNSPDTTPQTTKSHLPLHYTLDAYGGKYDEDVVKKMLNYGAKANASGITDDKLFADACCTASVEILEIMLKNGADVNEIDKGQSALMCAAWHQSDINKIRFLVENGATLSYFKPSNETYTYGQGTRKWPAKSVLDIAEERCSVDVVNYLLSMGAKHGSELETENIQ